MFSRTRNVSRDALSSSGTIGVEGAAPTPRIPSTHTLHTHTTPPRDGPLIDLDEATVNSSSIQSTSLSNNGSSEEEFFVPRGSIRRSGSFDGRVDSFAFVPYWRSPRTPHEVFQGILEQSASVPTPFHRAIYLTTLLTIEKLSVDIFPGPYPSALIGGQVLLQLEELKALNYFHKSKMFSAGFDNEIYSRSARLFPDKEPIKCRYNVTGNEAKFKIWKAAKGGGWLRHHESLLAVEGHLKGNDDSVVTGTAPDPLNSILMEDTEWPQVVRDELLGNQSMTTFIQQLFINACLEEAVVKNHLYHGVLVSRSTKYASIKAELDEAENGAAPTTSVVSTLDSQESDTKVLNSGDSTQEPGTIAQMSEAQASKPEVVGKPEFLSQEQINDSGSANAGSKKSKASKKRNKKTKGPYMSSADVSRMDDTGNQSNDSGVVATTGKDVVAPAVENGEAQQPLESLSSTIGNARKSKNGIVKTGKAKVASLPALSQEDELIIKSQKSKDSTVKAGKTKVTGLPALREGDKSIPMAQESKDSTVKTENAKVAGLPALSQGDEWIPNSTDDDRGWSLVQPKSRGANKSKVSMSQKNLHSHGNGQRQDQTQAPKQQIQTKQLYQQKLPEGNKEDASQTSHKKSTAVSKLSNKAREFDPEDYPPMSSSNTKKELLNTVKTSRSSGSASKIADIKPKSPSQSHPLEVSSEKAKALEPGKSSKTFEVADIMLTNSHGAETKSQSAGDLPHNSTATVPLDFATISETVDAPHAEIVKGEETALNKNESTEEISNYADNDSENIVITGDISWADLGVRNQLDQEYLGRRQSFSLDLPSQPFQRSRSHSLSQKEDTIVKDIPPFGYTFADKSSLMSVATTDTGIRTYAVFTDQFSEVGARAQLQTFSQGVNSSASVADAPAEFSAPVRDDPLLSSGDEDENITSADVDRSTTIGNDSGNSQSTSSTRYSNNGQAQRSQRPDPRAPEYHYTGRGQSQEYGGSEGSMGQGSGTTTMHGHPTSPVRSSHPAAFPPMPYQGPLPGQRCGTAYDPGVMQQGNSLQQPFTGSGYNFQTGQGMRQGSHGIPTVAPSGPSQYPSGGNGYSSGFGLPGYSPYDDELQIPGRRGLFNSSGAPMFRDEAGYTTHFDRPQARASEFSTSNLYNHQEFPGGHGNGMASTGAVQRGSFSTSAGNVASGGKNDKRTQVSTGSSTKSTKSGRTTDGNSNRLGDKDEEQEQQNCLYCHRDLSPDDDLNFVCLGCTARSKVRYCSNACRLVHARTHAGLCGTYPLIHSEDDLTEDQKALLKPIDTVGTEDLDSRPLPHHDKYRQRAFSMHCSSGDFPPLIAAWMSNQSLSVQEITQVAPTVDESKKKTGEYFIFRSENTAEDENYSRDATVVFTVKFPEDDPRKKALKRTLNGLYFTTGNSAHAWTTMAMELAQFAFRMIRDVIKDEYDSLSPGVCDKSEVNCEFLMQFKSEFFFDATMQSIQGKFDFEGEWPAVEHYLDLLELGHPFIAAWS